MRSVVQIPWPDSSKQVAGISGIDISMMENGKRPIGKKNARVLAKVLDVDYRIFL